MKNIKFCGNKMNSAEKFLDSACINPNSAVQFEIPQSVENCGPYSSGSEMKVNLGNQLTGYWAVKQF